LADNEEVLLDAFEQVSAIASKGQAYRRARVADRHFYLIESRFGRRGGYLPADVQPAIAQLRNGRRGTAGVYQLCWN